MKKRKEFTLESMGCEKRGRKERRIDDQNEGIVTFISTEEGSRFIRWVGRRMNYGRTDGQADGRMDRRTKGITVRRADGRMKPRMDADGRTNNHNDRRTDKQLGVLLRRCEN